MAQKIIRTAEELSDCLVRNDPANFHWELDFSGAHALSDLEKRLHSIVVHAPHSSVVRIIDLSLRRVSAVRAAGIAEMLGVLRTCGALTSPLPARMLKSPSTDSGRPRN